MPEYKGSTFRGAFGYALKQVVCALKRNDCKECLLKNNCFYAYVFELRQNDVSEKDGKKIAALPHPYVIEPPDNKKISFKKGDDFNFDLLLFGKANDGLPYFIYAFEVMSEKGIGRGLAGGRGKYKIVNVQSDGKMIYNSEKKKINNCQVAIDLNKHFPANDDHNIDSIELNLLTPLRLKYQNTLKADIPFHVLIRAALRRVSSLFDAHGDGEPALDYRNLVKRADHVAVLSSSLVWHDWERYSNRQERQMLMGGMIGKITYRGNLSEYMPLLHICEQVHLGKQTTFGLGKIKVKVL